MTEVNLRDRCKAFLNKLRQDAMLRQGSPVDDLIEFVVAERGREAEPSLEDALPLCMYFANEADREEFIAVVQEANPNMTMRKTF